MEKTHLLISLGKTSGSGLILGCRRAQVKFFPFSGVIRAGDAGEHGGAKQNRGERSSREARYVKEKYKAM